ncbi:glycosyltransferase [Microbacterium jiangjiandongii]|uniref:glycosyltransferase n=1 Tax=Microbacterium jiangjiandongii TaxID=3049071 RepID=UPI00214B92CC|nr:glycosyltransferase [Microbacterium sp. zg.Y843]MCR2815871.1 glycosyltransferase [Microbacterium sp. zg.Y843]
MNKRNFDVSHLDYLVGGLRISVGAQSGTPGPRTHIVGFINGLGACGVKSRTMLASDFPGLERFARIRAAVYGDTPRWKVFAGDLVRLGALFWSGVNVLARSWSRRAEVDVIYERVAVFQSLSSFHPSKRRAIRVVEANAVMTRETAHDRKAIVLERLAASVERHAFRAADLIVAVSPAVARDVIDFAGVKEERVLVLANGTSVELTEVALDSGGPIRVGFVGSVGYWQRIDRLIQAIADMTDSEVVLEIIGDGAARADLEAQVDRLQLRDRVTFTGRLAHAEAVDRMRSWSVGYAGHEKTWAEEMYHSPLKLYEYAALGLQLLCSDSPDALALAESGVAVCAFDPSLDDDLARALAGAVEAASLDTTVAREARRAAVREGHSWEARARTFLARAEEVSGQRQRHR